MKRGNPKPKLKLPDAINCSLTKDFTQVPNDLLRNPGITAKAKAILCLLLSNSEGWQSHLATVQKMMKEGKNTIQSALQELEQLGYLIRVKYRDKATKAWRGSFWAYTDTPKCFNIDKQLEILNNKGFEPQPNFPELEKPELENRPLRIPIDKNTNEYISPTQKNEDKIPSLKQRNLQYLPIAQKLSDIIQAKKNIKHTTPQITAWTNDIRQMVENNGIEQTRIEKVLGWYENNISRQYVPVIESGSSLKDKFIRLEAAMLRDTEIIPEETGDPKEIILTYFKGKKDASYAQTFYRERYVDAEQLLRDQSNGQCVQLAHNLVELHDWLTRNQSEKAKESNQIPGPTGIVDEYIRWLSHQDWIANLAASAFTPESILFRNKFLPEYNDGLGLDVLTGKYSK